MCSGSLPEETALRHYLIVDDNREYAENLAEILEAAGAEVAVAGSGPEALALARATRFDAVVTDMQMPQMSGGTLLQELRRLDPGLAVLVVTAYTRHAELERVKRDGLLAVLPKPTPLDRLARLLERARPGGLLALVQDDPATREGLQETLENQGFTTVPVGSVAELDSLGEVALFAALVALDGGGAPDGDAVRLLRSRFPGLPVIVAALEGDATTFGGSLHFLPRPFNPEDLIEAVEHVYEERTRPD